MSAYLDKSQGVTFVYSNIHEIVRKAKDAKLDAPFIAERAPAAPLAPASERVLKAGTVPVSEFTPGELKSEARPFPVPMGVRDAEEKAKRQNMRPIANLQKNLNELTDAHEKLRFLLQELEGLTKKKG